MSTSEATTLQERALAAWREAEDEQARRDVEAVEARRQRDIQNLRQALKMIGIDAEPIAADIHLDGIHFRYVRHEYGDGLAIIVRCPKCGSELTAASSVYSLAEVGRVIASQDVPYHQCPPRSDEEEPPPPQDINDIHTDESADPTSVESILGARIAIAEEERAERRRYALLQAATQLKAADIIRNDWGGVSEVNLYADEAEKQLAEIERREGTS
jgi:hypothetical protein